MTEMTKMAKLICTKFIQGEDTLLNLSTVHDAVPNLVKLTPGVGKPFWYWASIPVGRLVACDFTNAPIATNNNATNLALMDAITVQPLDVLIYEEPAPPPSP